MSENKPAAAAVQVSILGQYTRDFSFESPSAPQIFTEAQQQPTLDLGVNVQTKALGGGRHEVVLMLKLEAKTETKTAFIVELAYAGLFALPDMPEAQTRSFLFVEAPQLLFPFARNIIADAIRDGGFPQVLVNPIDFLLLYRQQQEKMQTPVAGTA